MRLVSILFIIMLLVANKSTGQTGTISTIAGTGYPHDTGDGGAAIIAGIPNGSVYGVFTKNGDYVFSELNYHRVRIISALGIISRIAGNGSMVSSGDGGPATAAGIYAPAGVAFDSSGNLYIAEVNGSRIRKVNMTTGLISTCAGTGSLTNSGDGGLATSASLGAPSALFFDTHQNLFFANGNSRIRKIDANTNVIHTIAGTSTGFNGDGGPATACKFNQPHDICIDGIGNIYVADWGNARVRKIDISTGIINTIAGDGSTTYNGEGVAATSAGIHPMYLRMDHAGNIIIADRNNCRIRAITTYGTVITLAGNGACGYSGDGGAATAAKIYYPDGIALDECENIILPDNGNARIRKITAYIPVNPSITISAHSGNVLCYGMPVTFSSNTTYAGSSPAYQWKVNGANVGISLPTYTYTPANGDTIQCQLTSGLACLTTSPVVISNTIYMRVDTFLPPVVTVSGDSIAGAGTTVHLTASIAGSAGAYTLHWKNHGVEFTTTTVPSVTYTKTAGTDTITAALVSVGRACYDSAGSSIRLVYDHNLSSPPGPLSINGEGVTCYPNPANDVLFIETPTPTIEISVTDVYGRSTTLPLTFSHNVSKLDVSSLPAGVYFLRINKIYIRKFIKL